MNWKKTERYFGYRSNLSPVKPDDQKMYLRFFDADSEHPLYSNSWAYIVQACRGLSSLGYKHYNSQCLISIGLHSDMFVIVRPLGRNTTSSVRQLAENLWRLSSNPVYLKHLSEEDAVSLSHMTGFHRMDEVPWAKYAPFDDETFPQAVILLEQFHSCLCNNALARVRREVNRFYNHLGQADALRLTCYAPPSVMELDRFLRIASSNEHKWHAFAPAYLAMLRYPPQRALSFILHTTFGLDVGFALFERIGAAAVGCYASFFDYTKFPGCADACLTMIFRHLLQDYGIKTVNMGGSETFGLHRFKSRFRPTWRKRANHLVYHPDHLGQLR